MLLWLWSCAALRSEESESARSVPRPDSIGLRSYKRTPDCETWATPGPRATG